MRGISGWGRAASLLGIADHGDRIGSSLDAQWLRHRIYELTERKLTVDVREADLDGCRILVLATHEAIEPVRYRGRITWRVDHNCVEVDAPTWHSGRLHRSGFDWPGLPSGHTLEDVRPVAVELASRYLRLRGGPSDLELAEAAPPDLIRRLHLADGEGRLTNAGSLLFVATPHIGIDYIRRDVAGGDSRNRIRGSGPLLERFPAGAGSGRASQPAAAPGYGSGRPDGVSVLSVAVLGFNAVSSRATASDGSSKTASIRARSSGSPQTASSALVSGLADASWLVVGRVGTGTRKNDIVIRYIIATYHAQ